MSTHLCHNPNCRQPLPAHLTSHRSAWYALPKVLRDAVWRHYRAGQEDDKRATLPYLEAMADCIRYWRDNNVKCDLSQKPTSRRRIHQVAGAK